MARLAALQRKGAAKVAPAGPQTHAARAARRPHSPFGLPLQAKLALGPARGRFEAEADRAADHVVSERTGMPALSSLGMASHGHLAGPSGGPQGEAPAAPTPIAVQRRCASCDEELQRKPAGPILRKCACGGDPGEECSCQKKEDEKFRVDRTASGAAGEHDALGRVNRVVARSGRPLAAGVRADMEQRFGRSFERVRIHDDADAATSAGAVAAHAYTVGDHIVFGPGRYRPGTREGRFLLAHELAHTVQQSGGQQPQPAGRVSQPHDSHEREAAAAASAVMGARPVSALTPAAPQVSRYSFGEFLDDVAGVAGSAVNAAGELAGSVVDGAERAWDQATAIASQIGSSVTFSGGKLSVTIPEVDPCPEFALQFHLSDLGLAPNMYVPIAEGVLPLSGMVNLYGSMGVNLTIDPEVGVQLVGCSIGPSTITIDPLSLSATLSSGFSVTGAVSLGSTLDLGARGEVGVLVIIPDPPIPLQIPVAGLEIGGTAEARVIGGGTIADTFTVRLTALPGGLPLVVPIPQAADLALDLALGADLGVGAYGSVDVLGVTVCRLVWPLFEWHGDTAGRLGLSFDLSASTRGISASINVSAARLDTSPFDALPLAFDRSVLEDNCPLCDALYSLDLMPSQNGGAWHGHPGPPLGGPLLVYPKNPDIASGALCRGVCGVDCAEGSCTVPYDRYVCEEMGDGHVWNVYGGYIDCGTHKGCRDHDACYDWAAEHGEGGLAGVIFGPLHRLCDLECLCTYGAPTCVGWATANPPYDPWLMSFADYALTKPGCRGPCPEEVEGEEEGTTVQQTCLPNIELLEMRSFEDRWDRDFGPVSLYRQFIEVPYIVGVWVGVDAWAHAAAAAFAELGPVVLANACLIYDPATGEYHGTASLGAGLNVGGGISLTGSVDAWASDFLCLLRVVDMEGGLNARANAAVPSSLSYNVDLVCRNGELWLEHGVDLETCLALAFDLDAFFNLDVFNIRLIEERWNLVKSEWEDCWNMTVDFAPVLVGQAPTITFDTTLLRVFELIRWLFGEASDRRGIRDIGPDPARDKGLLNPCGDGGDEPPPGPPVCTEVVQDPVTSQTAHTLGSIADQIDRTDWSTELFSLPTGGSNIVGVSMESVYLTDQHSPGSGDTKKAQKDIYGLRKLPTLSAHGGSGYKQTQVYIKGHLLNENVGGPAEDHNLYPISGQANSDHKLGPEKTVKGWVNTNHLLVYYAVEVVSRSDPVPIDVYGDGSCTYYYANAMLQCAYATYKLCNDQILERNPTTTQPIYSTFDVAGFSQSVRDKGCPQR